MAQPIDKVRNIEAVYPFLEEFSDRVEELLESRERVLVAVIGKAGTGKTTFGRHIRRKGFGKFRPAAVCVIDDSRMSLDVLKFFRRKFRFRTPPERDELKPFFEVIPKRKRVVVFISQNPGRRISAANLFLRLKVDDTVRIQRLADRKGGIEKVPSRSLESGAVKECELEADVVMEGCVEPF